MNEEDEVKAEVRQSGNTLQVVFDYPGGRRVLTIEIIAFRPKCEKCEKQEPLEKASIALKWFMLFLLNLGGVGAGYTLAKLLH